MYESNMDAITVKMASKLMHSALWGKASIDQLKFRHWVAVTVHFKIQILLKLSRPGVQFQMTFPGVRKRLSFSYLYFHNCSAIIKIWCLFLNVTYTLIQILYVPSSKCLVHLCYLNPAQEPKIGAKRSEVHTSPRNCRKGVERDTWINCTDSQGFIKPCEKEHWRETSF